MSTVSTMSLNSYGRRASSITTIESTDGRMMPPPLDMARLPPLPPSRRELEEKARLEEKAANAKVPLISVSIVDRFYTIPSFGFGGRVSSIQVQTSIQMGYKIPHLALTTLLLDYSFLDIA